MEVKIEKGFTEISSSTCLLLVFPNIAKQITIEDVESMLRKTEAEILFKKSLVLKEDSIGEFVVPFFVDQTKASEFIRKIALGISYLLIVKVNINNKMNLKETFEEALMISYHSKSKYEKQESYINGYLSLSFYVSPNKWFLVRDLEFFFNALEYLKYERLEIILEFKEEVWAALRRVKSKMIQKGLLIINQKVEEKIASLVIEGIGAKLKWEQVCGPSIYEDLNILNSSFFNYSFINADPEILKETHNILSWNDRKFKPEICKIIFDSISGFSDLECILKYLTRCGFHTYFKETFPVEKFSIEFKVSFENIGEKYKHNPKKEVEVCVLRIGAKQILQDFIDLGILKINNNDCCLFKQPPAIFKNRNPENKSLRLLIKKIKNHQALERMENFNDGLGVSKDFDKSLNNRKMGVSNFIGEEIKVNEITEKYFSSSIVVIVGKDQGLLVTLIKKISKELSYDISHSDLLFGSENIGSPSNYNLDEILTQAIQKAFKNPRILIPIYSKQTKIILDNKLFNQNYILFKCTKSIDKKEEGQTSIKKMKKKIWNGKFFEINTPFCEDVVMDMIYRFTMPRLYLITFKSNTTAKYLINYYRQNSDFITTIDLNDFVQNDSYDWSKILIKLVRLLNQDFDKGVKNFLILNFPSDIERFNSINKMLEAEIYVILLGFDSDISSGYLQNEVNNEQDSLNTENSQRREELLKTKSFIEHTHAIHLPYKSSSKGKNINRHIPVQILYQLDNIIYNFSLVLIFHPEPHRDYQVSKILDGLYGPQVPRVDIHQLIPNDEEFRKLTKIEQANYFTKSIRRMACFTNSRIIILGRLWEYIDPDQLTWLSFILLIKDILIFNFNKNASIEKPVIDNQSLNSESLDFKKYVQHISTNALFERKLRRYETTNEGKIEGPIKRESNNLRLIYSQDLDCLYSLTNDLVLFQHLSILYDKSNFNFSKTNTDCIKINNPRSMTQLESLKKEGYEIDSAFYILPKKIYKSLLGDKFLSNEIKYYIEESGQVDGELLEFLFNTKQLFFLEQSNNMIKSFVKSLNYKVFIIVNEDSNENFYIEEEKLRDEASVVDLEKISLKMFSERVGKHFSHDFSDHPMDISYTKNVKDGNGEVSNTQLVLLNLCWHLLNCSNKKILLKGYPHCSNEKEQGCSFLEQLKVLEEICCIKGVMIFEHKRSNVKQDAHIIANRLKQHYAEDKRLKLFNSKDLKFSIFSEVLNIN